MFDPQVLPLIFAALMGVSILLYVVLDGFDLGVGLLFPFADEAERDRMIASIGPFWDANETWLVLAIGILLVAFPVAHGDILTALYLPVAVMLIGLILRGVAFEFRAKAPLGHKRPWDVAFWAGSLMTALSQGFMLGMYVMGLEWTWAKVGFAALTAGALAVAYSFIGAGWVILKTDGVLQRKAVAWAKGGIWGVVLGMGAVSAATPRLPPVAAAAIALIGLQLAVRAVLGQQVTVAAARTLAFTARAQWVLFTPGTGPSSGVKAHGPMSVMRHPRRASAPRWRPPALRCGPCGRRRRARPP
jgi:cytochrome bd-type quinol oxidase subunit 2